MKRAYLSRIGAPTACQLAHNFASSFGVARLRHETRDGVDAHAIVSRGAVFALAVHARELGGELRLLGQEFRVFGRGRRVHLQQHDLAAQIRRKLDVIEAVALGGDCEGTRGGLPIQ
jgi:hypothetical protein